LTLLSALFEVSFMRIYVTLIVATLACVAGCPTETLTNVVAGPSGNESRIGTEANIDLLAPRNDLNVSGGTLVESVYRLQATSPSGTVEFWFDPDQDPFNQNQIAAAVGLPLSQTQTLLDTSNLESGTYFVGGGIREQGTLVASDYAPGQVTVNARPRLQFTSPRGNFTFDRSNRVNPSFTVAWGPEPGAPSIDEDFIPGEFLIQIFLDASLDQSGDEVLLFETTSRFAESFDFELRTDLFEPGSYQIVAVVNDGRGETTVTAPGAITLRSRLAGMIDLRELDDPTQGKISGAIFEGFNPGDNAGSFISGLEDVDGDGFSDMMTLAQFGKPFYNVGPQRNGAGEGYLVYGRPERFTGRLNYNSTGTLFRGDIFTGVREVDNPVRPSRGITDFALMDDWDLDGLPELAFGLPFTDSLPDFLNNTGNLPGGAPLDPPGSFRSGGVVVAAGFDLRPDLGVPGGQVIRLSSIGTIIHAPLGCGQCIFPECCPQGFYGPNASSNTPCGATYFHGNIGSASGAPTSGGVRLGARFTTNDFAGQFGQDVDRYAFQGMIMSGPNRDPAIINQLQTEGGGIISLFFVGRGWVPWTTEGAPPAVGAFDYIGPQASGDRATLPEGGPYHYIVDDYQIYPFAVSGGGQTFFSGSPGYVRHISVAPPCIGFVISGNAPDEDTTFRLWSSTEGAQLSSANALQDINADGLQDIAIGAPVLEGDRGASFIFLGRIRSLMQGTSLQIEELALPQQAGDPLGQKVFDGLRVLGGPGERLGLEQESAGDINNDGIADVAMGSPFLADRRGGVGVLFGEREINNRGTEIPFNALGDPDERMGFILVGEDEGDLAGARVRSPGDIDGDGNDDLLIAAPNRSVRVDLDDDGILDVDRAECGVVYLVYGSPDLIGTIELAKVGTAELPGVVFIGRNSGDELGAGLGSQGDRSVGIGGAGDVDGDGFRDILLSTINADPRGGRRDAGEVYLVYGSGD
jgi:hypothetical protein